MKFINNIVKKILDRLKKTKVSSLRIANRVSKKIPSIDRINTAKKNFDFRGVFSWRPLENKNILRKEEYLLRLSGLMIISLLILVILLALTLKTLFPLQKIQPVFLSVASSDKQVYWVEPLEKKTKAFRIVTESLVYQYIEARESIDLQTENNRYEFVKWVSNNSVFEEFKNEFDEEKNMASPLKRSRMYNLSRGVKIIVIDFLGDQQLQVDFELFEYKRATGEIVSKKDMRATIKVVYESSKIEAKEKYMNPLGLRIIDYSLATKSFKEFIILKDKKGK